MTSWENPEDFEPSGILEGLTHKGQTVLPGVSVSYPGHVVQTRQSLLWQTLWDLDNKGSFLFCWEFFTPNLQGPLLCMMLLFLEPIKELFIYFK